MSNITPLSPSYYYVGDIKYSNILLSVFDTRKKVDKSGSIICAISKLSCTYATHVF